MTLLLLLWLPLVSLAQTNKPPIQVGEAALRADASVYPTPEYPAASIQAKHTGRVVIEVVVAPISNTSPLARVESSRVLETPDQDIANTVIESLKEARYMPFFDDQGRVMPATGRVVWEFRLKAGRPEVIDPNAVPRRLSETPEDDLRIARRARQMLSTEAVWNRTDNRQSPPNSKAVSLYCALEKATMLVTGGFEHRGVVMEEARAAIEEIAPHHPEYGHLLMGYNNDPSTTFANIQQVLRLTEERVSKRLKGESQGKK
jgi:hypothetical protein